MTHVTHSKMLTKRRRNQTSAKQRQRTTKQTRRKTWAGKAKKAA